MCRLVGNNNTVDKWSKSGGKFPCYGRRAHNFVQPLLLQTRLEQFVFDATIQRIRYLISNLTRKSRRQSPIRERGATHQDNSLEKY